MPREVKAFACQFDCRRNVTVSRKRMAEHEARCFHNPEQKACATCKHLATEWEEQYMGHQFGEAVFGSSYKVRYCEQEIDITERLRSNCPEWEAAVRNVREGSLKSLNQESRRGSLTTHMSKWLNRVLEEIGDRCGNCNQWRRLVDDYFLEKCPNCGDEEMYIFDVDEKEVP